MALTRLLWRQRQVAGTLQQLRRLASSAAAGQAEQAEAAAAAAEGTKRMNLCR